MSTSKSRNLISYFRKRSFFCKGKRLLSFPSVSKSTMKSMSLDFMALVHTKTAQPPIKVNSNSPCNSLSFSQLACVACSLQNSSKQLTLQHFCKLRSVPFLVVPQVYENHRRRHATLSCESEKLFGRLQDEKIRLAFRRRKTLFQLAHRSFACIQVGFAVIALRVAVKALERSERRWQNPLRHKPDRKSTRLNSSHSSIS